MSFGMYKSGNVKPSPLISYKLNFRFSKNYSIFNMYSFINNFIVNVIFVKYLWIKSGTVTQNTPSVLQPQTENDAAQDSFIACNIFSLLEACSLNNPCLKQTCNNNLHQCLKIFLTFWQPKMLKSNSNWKVRKPFEKDFFIFAFLSTWHSLKMQGMALNRSGIQNKLKSLRGLCMIAKLFVYVKCILYSNYL